MEKTNIIIILLLFFTIGYLFVQLNAIHIDLNINSILDYPDNTYVKISGYPSKIQQYSDNTIFYIEDIKINSKSAKTIQNESIAVFGKISKYNNSTYVEATKIEYINE